jgi:HNH endonuclease
MPSTTEPQARLEGPCLEFPAVAGTRRYGHVRFRGTAWKAHRYMWLRAFGEIPKGLCVLHKCDNPPCINPKHLFLGTQLDNIEDMVVKRRQRAPRGVAHHECKLTPVKVHAIRRSTKSLTQLALQYEVSRATICGIRQRRKWRHI